MRSILTTLIALSVSSAASAANWVFVADCGEQNQARAYSYDPTSIKREGGHVLVRIKGDYSRDQSSRASEVQTLWAFDCANRAFVERIRTEYLPDRKVLASHRTATGIMAIGRNSIAEKVFQRVCG